MARANRAWAEIGVISSACTSGQTIGPPAEKLYAVEPVGVEQTTPSHPQRESGRPSISTAIACELADFQLPSGDLASWLETWPDLPRPPADNDEMAWSGGLASNALAAQDSFLDHQGPIYRHFGAPTLPDAYDQSQLAVGILFVELRIHYARQAASVQDDPVVNVSSLSSPCMHHC